MSARWGGPFTPPLLAFILDYVSWRPDAMQDPRNGPPSPTPAAAAPAAAGQSPQSSPTTQTERVILTLREMLLRGDFAPNERLAELTLVRRLNASRTPVRLALDRLAREGVLEALPAGGFRVREFAIADIWDAIEIRGVLEGTAARFAAERLSEPDELLRLRLYCRDAEQLLPMSLENFVRYVEINDQFHAELWRLAKSPMLARTIESLIALPFASPGALVFGHTDASEPTNLAIIGIGHFRGIVDAIATREGTRAESLAREHARLARRYLATALRDRALFSRMPGASLVRLPVPIGAL